MFNYECYKKKGRIFFYIDTHIVKVYLENYSLSVLPFVRNSRSFMGAFSLLGAHIFYSNKIALNPGTVLGTCIDGFLFGACCRLPSPAADSVENPADEPEPAEDISNADDDDVESSTKIVVDNFIVSSSSARPTQSPTTSR